MNARNRSGFTLVELLVVIVIIGTIVGLLVPALLGARRRARITQCANNEKELAGAILSYETAKQHLPGYANQVGTGANTAAESWVAVLLPFLQRNDLWEGSGANPWCKGFPSPYNNTTRPLAVQINQLVCPDMPATVTYPLAYVVSWSSTITAGDQIPGFIDASGAAVKETGLFRETITNMSPSVMLSSVTSPTRRPMLAESTYSINSTRTTLTPADVADRQWNALASLYAGGALITGPAAVRNQLKGPPPSSVTGPCLPCSLLPAEMGFYWPATGTIGAANVLPPIHAGIVNVAFCDGHVDSLSNDTDCSVYDSPAVIP